MRQLTAEEREQLRARWGADALRVLSAVVDTDEGEETVSLVVRRPTLADYDETVDESLRPAARFEAYTNAATKCAVWPMAAELGAVFEMAPGLAKAAWDAIDLMMSGNMASADALPVGSLGTLTPEEMATTGITAEQIAAWKREHRRGCFVFRTPLGLWICKRPGFSAYSSHQRARNLGAVSASFRALVAECAVWPAPEVLERHLQQLPGVAIYAGHKLAAAAEKGTTTSGGI